MPETLLQPPDTRLALVLAAEARVTGDGWAALRMRDLATDVGIRAPSIYHHFATKADLGQAVVNHLHEETQSFLAEVTATHAALQDRIAHFIALVEGPEAESASCPLYNLQAEYPILPEPMQHGISQLVDEALEVCGGWISAAAANGEISAITNPRTHACVLFSILEHGQQLRRILTDVSVSAMSAAWLQGLQSKEIA